MFKSLKSKLKNWLGKEEKSEDPVEKPEKKLKSKDKPKKEIKKKSKTDVGSASEAKKGRTQSQDVLNLEEKDLPTDEELKELASKIKDSAPERFLLPEKGFYPDQDKLKEDLKEKEIETPPSEKKKSFFSKLKSKITTSTLTQENIDEIIEPLELILLENNVALEVVDKIKEDLSKDLIGVEVKKGKIEETIIQSLKDSISEVLIEPENLIPKIKKSLEPFTIIFFGINGSGKTTSIAKLAHKLKKEKISCVFAAADTFRAAAIQQLETHAKKLDIPIIKHDYGSDPTAVAFDAKKYAQQHKIKCVLIDTAGRMYTKENLIKQMEKIIRVIKPDLKIFVGESIAGNDSIEQAKTFNEAIGIDGIVLSKADVDEKGGTPLSVSYVTKKPIYFLGMGQNYGDLEDFKKDKILKNLGLE